MCRSRARRPRSGARPADRSPRGRRRSRVRRSPRRPTVPCSPPTPTGSCELRATRSGRPTNSGCAKSTPESTIVIGTPGPGGVSPSIPICWRHHSSSSSGSGVDRGLGDGVRPLGLRRLDRSVLRGAAARALSGTPPEAELRVDLGRSGCASAAGVGAGCGGGQPDDGGRCGRGCVRGQEPPRPRGLLQRVRRRGDSRPLSDTDRLAPDAQNARRTG